MKKQPEILEEHLTFPGYGHYDAPGQFFKYPMILEEYWYTMTGSEQKVLTFILRKTYGWQKQGDCIALSQFTHGDGTGFGTGLSRTQVKRVIKDLEARGFIKVTRYKKKPSYFELPLNEESKAMKKEGLFQNPIEVRGLQSHFNAKYMEEVDLTKKWQI